MVDRSAKRGRLGEGTIPVACGGWTGREDMDGSQRSCLAC